MQDSIKEKIEAIKKKLHSLKNSSKANQLKDKTENESDLDSSEESRASTSYKHEVEQESAIGNSERSLDDLKKEIEALKNEELAIIEAAKKIFVEKMRQRISQRNKVRITNDTNNKPNIESKA